MNLVLHRCPGLPSTGLMTYLAALGLARVVGDQADPGVRFGWSGETFTMRTTVTDLVGFLVDDYQPTPVVSPWNGGSGFGEKDKAQRGYVNQLARSDAPRLSEYRRTIDLVNDVMERRTADWPKERFVQELRNRLPDAALNWMDAAVVLATGQTVQAVFPPLLGTGGNDGRLDYSSNFHQRLIDVLPELGAPPKASAAWATDLLSGQFTSPLKPAAIGQFDPVGAGGPGSSAFGSADSQVNPWAFVLMVEGAMWFASAAARRLGELAGRAAMPFTVSSSPDGPTPGAAGEATRGELWAPVFTLASMRQLRQIMTEARAGWHGRTAASAADMYGAVHTYGVDRGIERFQRFGYLQRNGLAYVAVKLDTVVVTNRPTVALAIEPARRREIFGRASGAASQRHTRAFDSALTAFLRDPEPHLLLDLLVAQTSLEISAMTGDTNRSALKRPPRLAPAGPVLDVLAPLLARSVEIRVAAGLASGYWAAPDDQVVGIRALLMGGDPGGREPAKRLVVSGLGIRRLVDVLADLVVWQAQHPLGDPRMVRGFTPLRGHHFATDWRDVHVWSAGLLDDDLVERAFLGLLALDWRALETPRGEGSQVVTIDPDLAVLQAFCSGQVAVPGTPAEADDGRQGLPFDWPLRLRAGQVDQVSREAASLLSRSWLCTTTPSGGAPQIRQRTRLRGPARPSTHGRRLLAALAAPASAGALRTITVDARSDSDRAMTAVIADEGVLA